MNQADSYNSLRSILEKAKSDDMNVRLYGCNMIILAEGVVVHVSDEVVVLKQRADDIPDEFIVLSEIVKVQFMAEPQYF